MSRCKKCGRDIDEYDLLCETCLNTISDDEKFEWISMLAGGLVTMAEQFTGKIGEPRYMRRPAMKTAREIIDEKIAGWTMAEQSGVYYATSVLDDLREIRKAAEDEQH